MRIFKVMLSLLATSLVIQAVSASQVKEVIEGEYEVVTITDRPATIPNPHRLITRVLPLEVFPILPDSYRWVKNGNDYLVKKHRDAPEIDLEFPVFADHAEFPKNISYLTMINGANHQSFASAYPTNPFPESRERFEGRVLGRTRSQDIRYMDAHCIDHINAIVPEMVNSQNSSDDIRNRTCEPFKSYWGLIVRKQLVASLRTCGGYYMQLPYYSLNPQITENQIKVPSGVFFLTYSRRFYNSRDFYVRDMFHVPWNHGIHTNSGKDTWENSLNTIRINLQSYKFLPYIYGLEGEAKIWWDAELSSLVANCPLKDVNQNFPNYMASNVIKTVADWEAGKISYKLRHLAYSHVNGDKSENIKYWHKRALKHGTLLLEFDQLPINAEQENEVAYIRQAVRARNDIDPDATFSDLWRQLITEQEDAKRTKSTGMLIAHSYNTRASRFFNLRNSIEYAIQNPSPPYVHEVIFGRGKGKVNALKKGALEDRQKILKYRRIHIKYADKMTVEAWLWRNNYFIDLQPHSIDIVYTPKTYPKSWKTLEEALRQSAAFNNIHRVFY